MRDFETTINQLLDKLARRLNASQWKMATAESCTGGWIAKCCTDQAGSSAWFDRGYIAYSYEAKEQMLGVTHEELLEYGAVSDEIAARMAIGARQNSSVEVTVSATGIAGPGGGMPGKPVGLVHFGWCVGEQSVSCEGVVFEGDRESVRQQTVIHALKGVLVRIPGSDTGS